MGIENVFTIYNFVEALWILLPAYAANGLIPIFKGRHPIDGGKKFIDGRPIFGEGKTWEGLFFGSIIGMVISAVMFFAFPYLPWDISPVKLYIVPMSLQIGFLLGFGSVIGDMMGSFVKRRVGIKRGNPAPILDQDDFVLGAFLFSSLLVSIKLEWVVIGLIMTPLFHLTANIIGYKLKLKKEPW